MNRHTQIRQAVLARLREQCGDSATFFDGLPAFIDAQELTHPRYGMGKRLGAADVDKWALYVIGQYCDQSVPDGFGGTESRITCNAYLTTQRKAWDVLSDFCSARRLRSEVTSLKLYPNHSRNRLVRGVIRKHQTGRLQSPSAMIITLTVRLLFRPLSLTE